MSSPRKHDDGVIGVLLAAGRGRRMGTTKQLLPWPAVQQAGMTKKTVVAAAFDAIQPFCDDMVVVLGHEADAVRSALQPRSYLYVLVDPDAPMFSSVIAGVSEALKLNGGAVLLHLADHPGVKPQTVRTLIERSTAQSNMAVMPEFQGKGGHPVWIPRILWQSILDFNGNGGLRAFWLENLQHCERVPVDDRGAVADLDIPDDYRTASTM